MKTRTLLLLAVASGLLILAAGSVKLFLIAGDQQQARLAVGGTGRAGDMTVTVTSVERADGQIFVGVSLKGVDDPDGATPFVLLAGGRALQPLAPPAAVGAGCQATAVAASVDCVLAFRTDKTLGVLRYERGDEPVLWDISAAG